MKKLILLLSISFLLLSCSNNDNASSSNNNPQLTATPVKDIDGNSYNTVVIGKQVWMQRNLDVTHYRNGDIIPQVTDSQQWKTLTTGASCYYENDPANASYGKLYNAYAVHDPRGLAPLGVHVASATEYQTLFDYCFTLGLIGNGLRETGFTHWSDPNDSSNITGFTALGTGDRAENGGFQGQKGYSRFWTSTKYPGSDKFSYTSWIVRNNQVISGEGLGWTNKIGCPVRCIKD